MSDLREAVIAIGMTLFAMFGACVGWLNTKDPVQRKNMVLFSEVISAAFGGLLIFCLWLYTEFSLPLCFMIAGVTGRQGAKGVEWLAKYIYRMVEKASDVKVD